MVHRLIIGAAVLLLATIDAWAHGEVHGQIIELTQKIEANPKDAALYLKRGELYRVHGDFDQAHADFQRSSQLDTNLVVLDLAKGRLFLEANWPHSSKVALDKFLERHTNHIDGLTLRARCLVKLGQHLDASKDFTRAINSAVEPMPELYIERAQALSQEGEKYFAEALQGLEEGMKKMGNLVTLQLFALDIEVKQKSYDAALARLDKVAAASPRKETWLARKGEVLQQAGRNKEAKAAYQAALRSMADLPPARRHVPAMQELEKRIKAAIEGLKDAKS